MIEDAESHADEDKKKRELVEAKNDAEALIHSTEKQLKDNGRTRLSLPTRLRSRRPSPTSRRR